MEMAHSAGSALVVAEQSGSGEPDPIRRDDEQGSDVGGPAEAPESSLEDNLDDSRTVGSEGSPDSQSHNPM